MWLCVTSEAPAFGFSIDYYAPSLRSVKMFRSGHERMLMEMVDKEHRSPFGAIDGAVAKQDYC